MYECRIKYASKMAGCIPWDYPTTMDMNDTEICTHGHWKQYRDFEDGPLEVFQKHMQNDMELENCNCAPNCEEVVYQMEVG